MQTHSRKVETVRTKASACRCICGSLLARAVPQGIELKCRKCKRHVILPLKQDGRARVALDH